MRVKNVNNLIVLNTVEMLALTPFPIYTNKNVETSSKNSNQLERPRSIARDNTMKRLTLPENR